MVKERELIYELDGKISITKAIPFGLQHVLAMFMANVTPILIVGGAAKLSSGDMANLIQAAMVIAGIGTILQIFPLGPLGSRLPIVMGISFTFVGVFTVTAAQFSYQAALGAALIGGCVEGCLGLFAKYWRKYIPPIVSASVVTSIGASLLPVGANSFGGGFGNPNLGDASYIIVGTITLISCLAFNVLAKSFYKQLSVLFGLIVGYIVVCVYGMVNLSGLASAPLLSVPRFMPFQLEFHPSAIITVTLIFLVSATETIGDTSAMTAMGLNRDATDKEISGSLCVDGFISSFASLFGCIFVIHA